MTGCVGLREEILSRPQTSVSDGGFSREGQYQQDGVQIYVRPDNSIQTGNGTSWFGFDSIQSFRQEHRNNKAFIPIGMNAFYMEFFIRTEKPLNIQLDQFILTLADGTRVNATARTGPLPIYSTRNYALPLCRQAPHLSPDSVAKLSFVIRKDESMCFIAVYDVPQPHPSSTFRLDISGIYTDQGKLRLPAITFEPSKEIRNTP